MGKYILSQRFQAKAVISVSIIFVMTIHKIVSSTLAPLKTLVHSSSFYFAVIFLVKVHLLMAIGCFSQPE